MSLPDKMPLKKLCHLRVEFTNRWFSIDRPFRRRNSPKSAMSERAGILITEPCMVNPPMNLTPECRLDFPSQLRGVVAHNLGIGKCLSIVDVWELVRFRKNNTWPFLTSKRQRGNPRGLAVRQAALLTSELTTVGRKNG